MAPPPSQPAAPAYKPPEPDVSIKYQVLLGLPPDLAPRHDDPALVDDLGQAIERFERLHLERILQQTPDKKEAARRLNISLSSLYRKIEVLGIDLN